MTRRTLTPLLALCLTAALFTSCAASNFDFDAVAEGHGSARAARLVDDLAAERAVDDRDDDEALYDLGWFPLLHLDMHVFAATDVDDDDVPPGFFEVDIESYLPLFMLVDATFDRYDEDLELYEHHEVDALLWGLWASHHEAIATPRGLRTASDYRLLWFIGWGTSPKYTDVDA